MTCIFCKKIGLKRSFLPEIGAWTFYYPLYGVATAYSTNENPSTDKLSRAINYIVILSLLYEGAYTAEHCWRGGSKCDFVTIQPLFHSSSLLPTTSNTAFPNSTHPNHPKSHMFPNSSHEVAKILPQRPQFVFRGIAMTVMTMKMIIIFVPRSRENIPRVSSSGHDVHPTKPTRVDDRV